MRSPFQIVVDLLELRIGWNSALAVVVRAKVDECASKIPVLKDTRQELQELQELRIGLLPIRFSVKSDTVTEPPFSGDRKFPLRTPT